MKITAGFGRPEDFHRLAQAGADELFAGFVPLEWLEKYGNDLPLNRREALLQNIQIDSFEDMRLLAGMKADSDIRVALTFNSPSYAASAYPMIGDLLADLRNIGFDDFIIADPGLLVWLRNRGFHARVHLSGEADAFSPDAARFFETLGVSRIIFPRKISPERMAECVAAAPKLEYEAFMLNEMCHYSGAFCASLHCDYLEPVCRLPYVCHGPDCRMEPKARDMSAPGAGGCGACALEQLQQAGVRYLKIVGRGGHTDLIERDIRMLRRALDGGNYDPDHLRKTLFAQGCGHNCYYNSRD